VYRGSANSRVTPKNVEVNKEPYCYVCKMWICWFNKRAIWLLGYFNIIIIIIIISL